MFSASCALFAAPPACDALTIGLKSENWQPNPMRTEMGPFWGQAFTVTLSSPDSFHSPSWQLEGAAIHDFDERISSVFEPGKGWQITAVSPATLLQPSFRLYFVPASDPPTSTSRKITLQARSHQTGEICETSTSLVLTQHPRPAELYTADHRDPAETNPEKGRVIDEHYPWHFFHKFAHSLKPHPSFLHWHRLYISRYQSWRTQFGYGDLTPWEPGADFDPDKMLFRTGAQYGLKPNAGRVWSNVFVIPSSPAFLNFEDKIIEAHDTIHNGVQKCESPDRFGCFETISSPKSELFWRFHLFLDKKFTDFCNDPTKCPPDDPIELN